MPANYKTIDPKFFHRQLSNEADRMLREFENIKQNKALNKTDEGSLVEAIVVDFLDRYLPKKLSVGRGYVMNSEGKTSLQQDIVIFNAEDYVPLKNTQGVQFYTIESVYATVEVKSTFTKPTLKKANKNTNSIKYLSGTAIRIDATSGEIEDISQYGSVVFSSIFAFRSVSKLQTCMQNVETESSSVDSVVILNKGLINYARVIKDFGDGHVVVRTTTTPVREDDLLSSNEEKDHVIGYEAISEENLGGILGQYIEQIVSHVEKTNDQRGSYSMLNYLKASTAQKSFRCLYSPLMMKGS